MKIHAKKKSSRRWLKEHFNDEFVKQANQQGWRSRAVFKLQELDQRFNLLKSGMNIVDLGAAPGGWSQYAVSRLKNHGRVFALDILEMSPIEGVRFIQGDFREDEALTDLNSMLAGQKIDLLLSDMAPNISGIAVSDQARAMYLAELALDFARQVLKQDGVMVVKLFQGAGISEYQQEVRNSFEKTAMPKPKASRSRSREVYLLARGFQPNR